MFFGYVDLLGRESLGEGEPGIAQGSGNKDEVMGARRVPTQGLPIRDMTIDL